MADRNTFSKDTVWKSLFDYIENNGEVCENTTSNIADRMATLNLEDTRNGSGDGQRDKELLKFQPSWRQYQVESGYVMGGCGWVANFRQGWERQANLVLC